MPRKNSTTAKTSGSRKQDSHRKSLLNTWLNIAVVIPTVFKTDLTDLQNAIRSLAIANQPKNHLNLSFVVFVDKAPVDFDHNYFERQLTRVTGQLIHSMWSHTQIGFTGAVNQAVTKITLTQKTDWILIFNDDAVAMKDFWNLHAHLRHQEQGILSCGVMNWQLQKESVGLQQTQWGVTLPTIVYVGYRRERQLFSGTCFFVATKTVAELLHQDGYFFFPLFFAYAEDFEMGVRLQRMGISVSVIPKLLVKHKGSQTTKRGSSFQLFYGLRNDWFVHQLHHHGLSRMLHAGKYWTYVILLCFYKGYWWLPFKIMCSVWKNRQTIAYWRKHYDQKLSTHYSF